MTVIHQSNQI